MSKLLPYFKWYPADAEGDDFYSLTLSNEELGIYHRLLNRSWMNDGVTADLDALAAFCRMGRKQFDKSWEKIGKRWVVSPRDKTKLVNPRQEQERESAKIKSEHNKRDGNANAKRTRSKRDQNDPLRAYESVSVSDNTVLSSEKLKQMPRAVTAMDHSTAISARWEEWWLLWSSSRGTNHRTQAAGAWMSVAYEPIGEQIFDCTRSYLESRLPGDTGGYNPENFLFDQARDSFAARWPKVRASPEPKLSATAQALKWAREQEAVKNVGTR